MKRINHIIACCLLVPAALLTSCNDWLDVQPRSEVEDNKLFESESGFKEALAGVYSSMVSEKTYTKEMLYGTIGILGQEWDQYPSAAYADMNDYNYSNTQSVLQISNIWATSYNSIANANNIINKIDEKKNLFGTDNFNIIKGESYALRAFLHFDLLRCFGVSYEQNADMPAIPYCTELTYRVFPQLTVKAVADKIEKDLLEAEALLKSDPIYTGRKITEIDDNGYLMNRRVHLNYYAVKGLQARLYMWMHAYEKAALCAQAVIKSNVFTWTTGDDLAKGYDYACAPEQLFALNVLTLSTLADTYFSEDNSTKNFSLNRSNLTEYYDNNTDDYRYLYQFASGTKSEYVDYCYLTKFNTPIVKKDVSEEPASFYKNKIPLIRLGEMYLILSECQYRASGSGLEALNKLRVARNLLALPNDPADFYLELIREYRRELIGEGQLFFLYKRLNRASVIGTDADMIGEKAYTFPIPISETDASQRENNR